VVKTFDFDAKMKVLQDKYRMANLIAMYEILGDVSLGNALKRIEDVSQDNVNLNEENKVLKRIIDSARINKMVPDDYHVPRMKNIPDDTVNWVETATREQLIDEILRLKGAVKFQREIAEKYGIAWFELYEQRPELKPVLERIGLMVETPCGASMNCLCKTCLHNHDGNCNTCEYSGCGLCIAQGTGFTLTPECENYGRLRI
jgi:hypothetical protein